MRQLFFTLVLTGFASMLPAAAADGISYNNVDLGFVSIDPDGAADDFSGIGLRGSVLVNPNVFITGSYYTTSVDTGFGDLDRTDLAFGAGYRHPINEKSDVYGKVEYLNIEVDPNFDDDGLKLEGGVRVAMSNRFELRGNLQFIDVGDADTVLEIGAEYDFMPQLAGFFELRSSDDYGGYFIGARYQF